MIGEPCVQIFFDLKGTRISVSFVECKALFIKSTLSRSSEDQSRCTRLPIGPLKDQKQDMDVFHCTRSTGLRQLKKCREMSSKDVVCRSSVERNTQRLWQAVSLPGFLRTQSQSI